MFTDSHCHLAGHEFAADLKDVVARAHAADVQCALVILAAGDHEEAEQAERLAALWPEVRFATGVHPHQANDFAGKVADIPRLLARAIDGNPRLRAIGEIGLDYHYDFSPRDVQVEVFRVQVEFALERGVPVVIHTREATADTFDILRSVDGLRGVFHCFTGDVPMARSALAIGFHLSFAGIVTFPRAPDLREIASWVPDERFLIETDSPYLAPVPFRGERNEPARVIRVAEVIGEARGATSGEIGEQTTKNFRALFAP
ncbi:MAG TPA: TatD family hydrolase [Gemmatimonadaceae bacterium]|nr:TatD family hydrolase [Gemmatimonadaceae bacterium]